jgi:hypothetical protein
MMRILLRGGDRAIESDEYISSLLILLKSLLP